MATWREMGLENRNEARHLISGGYFRGGISRSYYSAYCAVTSELAGRLTFAYGGNNPSHADLPKLILSNIYRLTQPERWEVRKAVGELWKLRVEADYVPSAYIDRNIAVGALRSANRVLFILGMRG